MSDTDQAAVVALPTVEELLQQRPPRVNVKEAHAERMSFMDRLALWITQHVGTMGFFLLIVLWTIVWLGWNTLAQRFGWGGVFDKPWQFGIWLFVSNLLQIMLMPLIMLGQNVQSNHAELRAEREYETTTRTERETEAILRYLAASNQVLGEIQQRLAALEDHAPAARLRAP